MKKAIREMQTLRAGCSKAEPKIFAPPQTPFPGGARRPKFNQLEMVTTFTYKPSLVRIDAPGADSSTKVDLSRRVIRLSGNSTPGSQSVTSNGAG